MMGIISLPSQPELCEHYDGNYLTPIIRDVLEVRLSPQPELCEHYDGNYLTPIIRDVLEGRLLPQPELCEHYDGNYLTPIIRDVLEGRLLPQPELRVFCDDKEAVGEVIAVLPTCRQLCYASSEHSRLRPTVQGTSSSRDMRAHVPHSLRPHKELSVDEAMVGFKGRLSWRQYMLTKPKWGMKVWDYCDATNGYCSTFQVYTGKEKQVRERGLGHRVVVDLVRSYFARGYHELIVHIFSYAASIDLSSRQRVQCICSQFKLAMNMAIHHLPRPSIYLVPHLC